MKRTFLVQLTILAVISITCANDTNPQSEFDETFEDNSADDENPSNIDYNEASQPANSYQGYDPPSNQATNNAIKTTNVVTEYTADSGLNPIAPLNPPVEEAPQVSQTTQPKDPNPLDGINMRAMSPPPQVDDEVFDVSPQIETVSWVGHYYEHQKRQVVVKILVSGKPPYEVFQEQNQSEQPELVIRFLGSKLRKKIARDIDTSEFRSPLAYVRMREDPVHEYVEVVMTLRDAVQPFIAVKDGNMRLSFPIPVHYFGKKEVPSTEVAQLETLEGFTILPRLEQGSQGPQTTIAMMRDPSGRAFGDESKLESLPLNAAVKSNPDVGADASELPTSYDNQTISSNATNAPLVQPPSQDVPQGTETDNQQFQGNQPNYENEDSPQEQEDSETEYQQSNQKESFDLGFKSKVKLDLSAHYQIVRQFHVSSVGQDNYGIDDYGGGYDSEGLDLGDHYDSLQPSQGSQQKPEGQGGEVGDQNNQLPQDALEPSPTLGSELPEEQAAGGAPLTSAAQGQGEDVVGGEETAGATFKGQAISIEFHKTPFALVLKTFSEESGNNFTFPEEIGNIPITVHLKQVPWDEALKAILETNGLAMAMVGQNIVRIDVVEKMSDYMDKVGKAKLIKQRLVPVKVLVMRLNHASSREVSQQVTSVLTNEKSLDPRIQIAFDERTNSILAEATPLVLSKIKSIVERIDNQTPLIEIASRIVEVTKSNDNFLGVVWSNSLNWDPGRALGFGTLNFPNSASSDFSVDPNVTTRGTAGNTSMRFGSINRVFDLDLLLKMEETKGSTQILQSNRVLVLDRIEARIISGETRFFQPPGGGTQINTGGGGATGGASAGSGSGLSEVEFNLELRVTPEVTANGLINMQVFIASDSPGPPQGALATRNTRQVNTRMSRANGETAVIGGIYDTKKSHSITGVPFLSSLPIIGALFRSETTSETLTELLIMITPRVAKSESNAKTSANGNVNSIDSNLAPSQSQNANANNGSQGQEVVNQQGENDEGEDDQGNY